MGTPGTYVEPVSLEDMQDETSVVEQVIAPSDQTVDESNTTEDEQ